MLAIKGFKVWIFQMMMISLYYSVYVYVTKDTSSIGFHDEK